jgi:hypothetical protein
MNTQSGIFCDPASLVLYGDAKPVRDHMRNLERVNRGEPERTVFSTRIETAPHTNRTIENFQILITV